jgi:hypothetical protein
MDMEAYRVEMSRFPHYLNNQLKEPNVKTTKQELEKTSLLLLFIVKKSKAIPLTGYGGLYGCEM